jgi:hypothetical protein
MRCQPPEITAFDILASGLPPRVTPSLGVTKNWIATGFCPVLSLCPRNRACTAAVPPRLLLLLRRLVNVE